MFFLCQSMEAIPEYILLCGLLQDKGKGSKNDIGQDKNGSQIYVQQVYNAHKDDY